MASMNNRQRIAFQSRIFLTTLAALLCLGGVARGFAAEPIKVGVVVSLTGQYAAPGHDLLAGIQMWVDDINARGALLGRTVEIVYYDDRSDPATTARLYERLINVDRVDLLIGPYASDLTLAACPVIEKYDFPMVSGSASASDIWSHGYGNIFQVDTPAVHYMDLLITSAHEAGLQSIALVYAGSEFPRDVARGVREQAVRYGMQIVYDREFAEGTTDFSGLVREMKAAAPDVVIGGTYLDGSIALMREAKRQQFSPKAFAFTVGPALVEFGEALGPDSEGVLGVVSWMRSGNIPMAYDFSYRYKEKTGHNAAAQAASGYAAGQVLEAAVRLAGTLDREAVRQQLRDMVFASLLGRYHVDETGKQVAKDTYVMQWQNGKRLLVLPRELRDSKIIYPFPPWSAR